MSHPKVSLETGSGKRRVAWHVAHALAASGYALAIRCRSSAEPAAEAGRRFHSNGTLAFGP
jgi:hypothetical protein